MTQNSVASPPIPQGRRHNFSPAVAGYLEGHAADPDLAWDLGVRSDGDAILYPYVTPRGESYTRRRDLTAEKSFSKQPKGEPLILWWPAGRPHADAKVLLAEGEPDALAALSALNGDGTAVAALPGVGIPAERVTAELASAECVYLALDGDQAGRKAADRIARALQAYTALRVLKLGDGEDLASRLAAEDDREGWLRGALEAAPEAPKLRPKAEPQGYGRAKKADRLRELRARGLDPDKPLAELLDSLVALVHRFVVLADAQAWVIALWVAHAHAIDAADSTPYLAITSAEKRSGKSRLLELLSPLVPRPIEAANISEAALFRSLAGETSSTLLFDEIDGTFGPKARDKEDLRSLINAGYRRGAKAYRCVGDGSKQKVEAFEVFGAKALAGIGELPDTLADRSIPIRLRRRSRSEPVARGRYRTITAAAEPVRELLACWAEGAVEQLRDSDPELPDELDDRAQDGAEPLLAIADLAGEDWPNRARAALVEIHTAKPEDADSWGVQLLANIRDAFNRDEATAPKDRLATAELLERLRADPEAPWAGWDGDGLKARALARMLGRYEIKSKKIRVGDDTPRGYLREDFEDAWTRYTSPDAPPKWNMRNNRINKPKIGGFEVEHEPPVFHFENGHKPHGKANVPHVPLKTANREPEPALCRYDHHREHDYVGAGGQLICGICHPAAAPQARAA
jgi:hypothetical protein